MTVSAAFHGQLGLLGDEVSVEGSPSLEAAGGRTCSDAKANGCTYGRGRARPDRRRASCHQGNRQ